MSDDATVRATFESVERHEYSVRLVTAYEVVHSSNQKAPGSSSMSFGTRIALCPTREEAERLAQLLCDTKYHKL